MIFEDTNLETATDDELNTMELGHVALQLMGLGHENRLCTLKGREIIAEYGMKGNFDSVARQLNMYSLALQEIGLLHGSREAIIQRKMRLIAHREHADSDDVRESQKFDTILESVKTRDRDHVINTLLKESKSSEIECIKIRQEALHSAGLCTCYTN